MFFTSHPQDAGDPPSEPRADPGRRLSVWTFFPVAMILLAGIIFWPAVSGPFLYWDDQLYITNSPLVTECSLANIGEAFTSFHFTDYAPLNTIALSFEYALMGPRPWAFHLITILLHAINAALVFLILKRPLRDRRLAALAAVIFLAHPLQVEAVAWIAEHKLVLCGTFFFGTILAKMRNGPRWAILALGMAAMFVKPPAIVLPPILAAYDRFVLGKRWRDAVGDQVPLGLVAAFMTAMNMLAQHEQGAITSLHGGILMHAWGMLTLPGRYIAKLLLPIDLCPLYKPFDVGDLSSVVFLLITCVAAAMSVRAIRRGRRMIAWALVWWWLAWLPVSNIVPMTIWMADRFMYLPLPGMLLAAASWSSGRPAWQRRKRLLFVGGMAAAALFSVLSHHRASLWKSDLTLWRATAECSRSAIAETNLAVAFFNLGQLREAKTSIFRAFAFGPKMSHGYGLYGDIVLMEGKNDEAALLFLAGALLDPQNAPLWNRFVRARGTQTKEWWMLLFHRLGKEPNGAVLQKQLLKALAQTDPESSLSVQQSLQPTAGGD